MSVKFARDLMLLDPAILNASQSVLHEVARIHPNVSTTAAFTCCRHPVSR